MPPRFEYGDFMNPEPVEFSLEDARLNTWVVDDSSVYLQLEVDRLTPPEEPAPDRS